MCELQKASIALHIMYTFHLLWRCIRSFSDEIFCERLSRPAPEHRGFFESLNPHLVWNVALICDACSINLQQQEAAFFSVDRTFSCSLLDAHSGLGTVVCSTALQQMFELRPVQESRFRDMSSPAIGQCCSSACAQPASHEVLLRSHARDSENVYTFVT